MSEQHEKETDPITSGNRMTNDDIAGRDQSGTAAQNESDSKSEHHEKEPQSDNQDKKSADSESTNQPDSEPSSDEAPDLSHEADEDGDVTPSDADDQQK